MNPELNQNSPTYDAEIDQSRIPHAEAYVEYVKTDAEEKAKEIENSVDATKETRKQVKETLDSMKAKRGENAKALTELGKDEDPQLTDETLKANIEDPTKLLTMFSDSAKAAKALKDAKPEDLEEMGLKELKGLTEEQIKERAALVANFAVLAIKHINAENLVYFFKFIYSVLRQKDYVKMTVDPTGKAVMPPTPGLESDLAMICKRKYSLYEKVFRLAIVRTYQSSDTHQFAGIKDVAILDGRLKQIEAHALQEKQIEKDTHDAVAKTKLDPPATQPQVADEQLLQALRDETKNKNVDINDFIAQTEIRSQVDFEKQRVRKLKNDLVRSVQTSLEALKETGHDGKEVIKLKGKGGKDIAYGDIGKVFTTFEGKTEIVQVPELDKDGNPIKDKSGRMKLKTQRLDLVRDGKLIEDGEDYWRQVTGDLLDHLEYLVEDPPKDADAEDIAQRRAALSTLLAARNALDILQHSDNSKSYIDCYRRHYAFDQQREGQKVFDELVHGGAKEDDETAKSASHVASEITAEKHRQAIRFTYANIFRTYFADTSARTQDYAHTVQHMGDAYSNPMQLMQDMQKILYTLQSDSQNLGSDALDTHINAVIKSRDGSILFKDNPNHHHIDITATALDNAERRYVEIKKANVGKQVDFYSTYRIQKHGMKVSDIVKELNNTVYAINGVITAAHQMEYVMHTGSQGDRKFFEIVADLLQSEMTGERMDQIMSLGMDREKSGLRQTSVDVVRMQSFIESFLMKRFGEKGWINDGEGKMFEEVFLNKGSTGNTVYAAMKTYLEENYPELPPWERDVTMRIAHGYISAARFRYQQLFSYMSPTRGFQGQAEDKQMKIAAFASYQKAFRFAGDWKHDFFFKGAALNSMKKSPADYDWWSGEDVGKEAFKVFSNGGQIMYGRLAWDMSEYFHDITTKDGKKIQWDLPEAFGPINRLKVGGYDTLRGWRLLAGAGVIDQRLFEFTPNGGPPLFKMSYKENESDTTEKHDGLVRLWKCVENIGVNDLQGFADRDIMDNTFNSAFGVSVDVDSKTKQATFAKGKEGLETFAGFLYERYMKDHEFGKSFDMKWLGHSGKVASVAEFKELFTKQALTIAASEADPKKRNGRILSKLVKPMVYDALTVVVAERQPTQFIYRLKNQDEQNGLRLDTQIKERYRNGQDGEIERLIDTLTTIDPTKLSKKGKKDQKTKRLIDALKASKGDKAARDELWSQVTDDLIFATSELRAAADLEILAHRKKWEKEYSTDSKTKRQHNNIYGDMNNLRSDVFGGRGYVMNDDTLTWVMLSKTHPDISKDFLDPKRAKALTSGEMLATLEKSDRDTDRALAARIRIAIKLRRDIIKEMGEKPKESAGEAELKKKWFGDPSSLKEEEREQQKEMQRRFNVADAKRMKRNQWFRYMWDEGYLGAIPFMADNSEVHKTFLNSDDKLVYRSTGECSVGEKYKDIHNPRSGEATNMLEMLKAFARKGSDGELGPLKSLITGFRKDCSDEIGDPSIFMPAIEGILKLQLTGLVNADEVRKGFRGLIGRWHSDFTPEGNSLYSQAYTYFEHNSLDAIGVRRYLLYFCKVNGINPDTQKKFLKMFGSDWFSIVRDLAPEYGIYLVVFITIKLVEKASKKEIQKKE